MKFKKINSEVLVSTEDIVNVGPQDLIYLKQQALKNPRKRIRLCAHKNMNDILHEMLIIHTKDTYVRVHKHLKNSESFHVIEGIVDVVIFGDKGNIIQVIEMGDQKSGRTFYQRISESYFHTLIIKSDFLVFHETTQGPFQRENTIFAPWAPEREEDGKIYMEQLKRKLSSRGMKKARTKVQPKTEGLPIA